MATVTTDAGGNYSVSGLSNIVYTVRVTDTSSALTGYAPTYERTELTTAPFNYQESVSLRLRQRHGRGLRLREAAADLRGGRAAAGVPGRRVGDGGVAHVSRGGDGGLPRPAARPRDGAVRAADGAARPGPGGAPAGRRLSLPRRGGADGGAAHLRSAGAGRPRPLAPVRAVHRVRVPSSGQPGPRCGRRPGPAAAGVQSPGGGSDADAPGPPRDRRGRAASGVRPEIAATGPGVQGDDARERDPLPLRRRHGPGPRPARGAGDEPDPHRSAHAEPSRSRRALLAGRVGSGDLLLRRAGREPQHGRERLLGDRLSGSDHERPARRAGGAAHHLLHGDGAPGGGPVSAAHQLPGPAAGLLGLGLPLRGLRRGGREELHDTRDVAPRGRATRR